MSASRPILRHAVGCRPGVFALALAACWCALGVATATAGVGDLTPAGCVGNSTAIGAPGPASCIVVDGLSGAKSVAVSPDGLSVYVAGISGNALNVFQRAANGDLTPAGCVGNSTAIGPAGPASCIVVDGLYEPKSVTVSPDGLSVYVAAGAGNAVNVFRRAANGSLTPAGCIGNSSAIGAPGPASCIVVDGLSGADSVAVSPDGQSVYVAASGGNALNVFRRAANGDLTPAGCIGNSGTGAGAGPATCIRVDGLNGASSVTVSPDGQSVYVAAAGGDALNVFRRAANGDLTPAGCIGNSSAIGAPGPASCIFVDGLSGASSVTVSPDGQSVYVAASGGNALNVFRRAANGDLTPAGCVGSSGEIGAAGPASCIVVDGLTGASSVTVSPDGQSVYVAGLTGNAVNVFQRAANGDLTAAGCVGNSGSGPASCLAVDGLNGAASVVVSPDGQSVYAAASASHALQVFRRATSAAGGSGATTSGTGATGGSTAGSGTSRTSSTSATTRTTTVTVGKQKILLSTAVPATCLAKSAKLTTNLNSADISGSTASTLRFVRAEFRIGRGVKHVVHRSRVRQGKRVKFTTTTYSPNRTVYSLPVTVSLPLTGLAKGSHTLTIRLVLGKAASLTGKRKAVPLAKTRSVTFRVC